MPVPSDRIERKLAAIMFTDIVGYTALMGESEEKGHRVRERHRAVLRPLVEKFHGEWVQDIGDESLSSFQSAVDAVNCALAIQSALTDEHELRVRVGIHLGDVVLRDATLHGDGVNVASRIRPLAEPGGICVSEQIYEFIKNQPNIEARPLGDQELKNVERRVPVFAVTGVAEAPRSFARAGRRMGLWAVSGLGALFVVGLAFWFVNRPDEMTVPGFGGRPAIAVLPFDNLSGDPEQEYFVDGLAEDLITRLSSWRGFPVIARNSSFVYQGRAVDVQQVGRELGARYIVEGSVRRSGDQVRISAQLIDGRTGRHIWAERYDRELADVFALQDEITEAIVGSMDPELLEFEGERAVRKNPANLDAWELAQRGWWLFHRSTREATAEARTFFEKAIELDPHLTWAFAGLSMTHWRDATFQWTDSRTRSVAESLRAAERSVELDDDDPHALLALGHAYSLTGQWEEQLAACEAAIRLDPSLAWGHYSRAGPLIIKMRRPDEAIASLEKAMRLSPHDPRTHAFYNGIGMAHFGAARYAEAVEWGQKSLQRNPEFPLPHTLIAASYAQLGRIEEARSALQKRLRLQTNLSLAGMKRVLVGADPDFRERYLDGLRKAGLPE
jgi:adenylate cyclase